MPDKKICPLLTIAKSAIVAHRKGDGDMVQTCAKENCAWWVEGYPPSTHETFRQGACAIKRIPQSMP